jgi:hypothetical protein
VEFAMLRTPNGEGEIKLVKFHSPRRPWPATRTRPRTLQASATSPSSSMTSTPSSTAYKRHGTELVGELVRYENSYWLCYVRGPEGIIVELAEKIG